MRFLFTLRSRLLLLTALSIAPSVVAVLWLTEHDRESDVNLSKNSMLGISQEISRECERRVEATRELLESLDLDPPAPGADTTACNNLLTTLLHSAPPNLANLGIVTRDGRHVCSALPMASPFDISERLSIRRALATGEFSVGAYTRSRIDGRPILGMALPVLDSRREIRHFNYATLDLSWFNQQAIRDKMATSQLPDGSTLLIFDDRETVFASFPDVDGRLGSTGPFGSDVLTGPDNHVFEGRDAEGGLHIFLKKRLAVGNDEFATLIMAVPLESIIAEANRHRAHWLLILGATATVLLAGAALFAEFGIVRRLQPVFSSLAALSRGENPPRNEKLHAPHEMGQLAVAIDDLAEQIRRRDRERTDFELALQKSEANYRALYKQTPAMLHSIDREGRLLHVSNHWLEKLGYARDEVIGRKSSDFLSEASRRRAQEEVLPEFFRTGRCDDIYYQMLTKSGETVDVLLSAIAVHDHQGEIAYSLASLVDVTEKLKNQKALQQTSDLLNTVFVNAPFIIMVLDSCARVIKTNLPSGTTDYSGGDSIANLSQLCGQILGCAHREDEKTVCGEGLACRSCPIREGLGEAMKSRMAVRDREISMQLMVDGNSTERAFLMSILRLQAYDEETFLVTLNDITQRKQEEAARLDMERQSLHAQKIESLGLMAGSVAHDFNNLLMAILGHLDLLDDQLPAGSTLRPPLAQANRATRQAAELTTQLLTYAGKGTVRRQPVNLAELIDVNIGLLQVLVSKKVALERDLDWRAPSIMADPGQFQQLVMNLVTNASEAIGDNPGIVRIRTSPRQFDDDELRESYLPPPHAGAFVVLEVADTGCGMDDATRQRLFDPFFSTKKVGRGLGMSSLLGIVRNLEGAVFVDSAPGRGTTIRLLFPAVEAVEAAAPAVSAAVDTELSERRFYGTMLIIEDEELVRMVAAEYSQMFGFEVMTAADGEEGVRLFCQHPDRIACILLDLTMPRMDGLEAFRRIRQVRENVPVILASGYIEEEVTEKFKGERLSAFLQKPYDKNELRQKLVEVFRKKPGAG